MTVPIAGVVVPILLHFLSPQAMPWWPDTVSIAIAFGATAGLVAVRFKQDREMNRRLWHALKALIRQPRT